MPRTVITALQVPAVLALLVTALQLSLTLVVAFAAASALARSA